MSNFLTKIGSIISTGLIAIASFFGGHTQAPSNLGSVLPSNPAVFETYLAAGIGTSDTSMTIASGSVRDGTSLSGYVCFTVDSNTPILEYMCGTVSGTNVTGLVRGIDAVTGTTSISSLIFSHRRGADVKITDYPTLTILARQASGLDGYAQPIKYDSGVGTSSLIANSQNLATVNYVNGVAFSGAGVVNATNGASGVSQLSTNLQAASSTILGSSGAALVLPGSIATSTYNPSGSLQVVVTKNNNKIDDNFISTSTLFTNLTLSTTTSIGSFPAYQIGQNTLVISSTGTSTFTVPSGIKKVHVRMVGGGGTTQSTGGCNSPGGSYPASGGGGGYAEANVDVSGTSTIQVFVGSAQQWSTFGTNGYFMDATGASGQTPGVGQFTGAGSTASTTGQIAISGQGGAAQGSWSVSTVQIGTPAGGSSVLGGGGQGVYGSSQGISGNNYGGGAGSPGCLNNASSNGGSGAQGVVIINW